MTSPFQANVFPDAIFNTTLSIVAAIYQDNVFQETLFPNSPRIIRRNTTSINVEETTPHLSILRRIVNKLMHLTSPTVGDSVYQDNVFTNYTFDTHKIKEVFAYLGFLKVVSNSVAINKPVSVLFQSIFQSNVFQSVNTENNTVIRGRLKIHDGTINIVRPGMLFQNIFQTNVFQNGDPETDTLSSLLRIIDSDMNIQSFRQKLRALLKIFDEDVNVSSFRRSIRQLVKTISHGIHVKYGSPVPGNKIFQNIFQTNIFQSGITEALRQLGAVKVLSGTINIDSGIPNSLRGLKRIISSDINIIRDYFTKQSLIRSLDEDINVSSFRKRIGQLLKTVSHNIKIIGSPIGDIIFQNIFQYSVFQRGFSEASSILGLVKWSNTDINVTRDYIAAKSFLKILNEDQYIQSFREYAKVIVKMVNSTINVTRSYITTLSLKRYLSTQINVSHNYNMLESIMRSFDSTVNITRDYVTKMSLLKMVNKTMNVQSFRQRARIILKLVSHGMNVTSNAIHASGFIKIILSTLYIPSSLFNKRVLLKIIDHNMNIQSFRQRARVLVKIFTSNINVQSSYYHTKNMFRTVTSAVNVQSFRQRVRTILKLVSHDMNITTLPLKFMGFIKIFNNTINVNDVPSRLRSMVKTVSHAVHVRGAESWLFVVTALQSGGTGITTNSIRLTDNEETGSMD